MKEIVFIATIFMEFSDEAVCNAFYKNYNSTAATDNKCSMIIRYNDPRNLSYGSLNDLNPPPMKRPDIIGKIRRK
jgi:hypothetical protein